MDDRYRKRAMLARKPAPAPAPVANFSRYRAAKASAIRSRRNLRDSSSSGSSRRLEKRRPACPPDVSPNRRPSSPIVMLRVGPQQRLFAAHESILSASPSFAAHCASQIPSPPPPSHPHITTPSKRIDLPDENPEVLSCVLEYLYKGDYTPRLVHNPIKGTWTLDDDILPPQTTTSTAANAGAAPSINATLSPNAVIYHHAVPETPILRDTAVYCAALTYRLPSLARLALRKQGLHMGIPCRTILASARFAYAHTPETESRLRAHYLALIIRCRGTFKRSGTMQVEMEKGGRLFFDLFVAMCNHMVSLCLRLPGGFDWIADLID
ncbi:uncharacterized protein N7496_009618 [Penicillium cataractarum]|uniref:BTB domain-containing protein n=1 Tax=Penicillium cataractarum TaxID=2100454 RepID=A0A9W9RPA2_9EURO|nr:uncharacterized protein N7496_009618 [Penicillium cataractarum]KAJ5363905.1 hypothetical protein N7496_009618 [Penicillium cataractarum]